MNVSWIGRLQRVHECQSRFKYTTMLTIFVICTVEFRDRKRLLVEKLPALITEYSRSRGNEDKLRT